MRKYLLFSALCVTLTGMAMAAWTSKPDKLHVVFFYDAAGAQHTYFLEKPVSFSDGLAVRSAIIGLAQQERIKGASFADSFLIAAEGYQYTDSGSLCYISSRSGGRGYYCGSCGYGGCASVKAIQ